MTTERLAQLRENLVEYFDLEELRTLCFDLGVYYDSLRGEGKEGKARELLSYLERRGRVRRLIELCNGLRPNVVWQEILDTMQAEPPFKGLDYFDVADADLFFGREALTANLAERLRSQSFLVVIGASGSGKSSVVRAGLVHQLRQSGTWATAVLTPGNTNGPFYALAGALLPLLDPGLSQTDQLIETRKLSNALRQGDLSLDEVTARILNKTRNAKYFLLVVDQFEELFTACKEEAERKAFVDSLLHATPETEGQTVVVITLRADFYAHCAQYANLRVALEKHQVYIGPMDADELRLAIVEPATRNGWECAPGLVDLILRDAGEEPGALPLLSHALRETWERRQGRTLTLAGYHDCGGVRGAIAKTADAVYDDLLPEQQQIARNIFLRLTELGEGTQDTRRRAALSELISQPEARPAVETVLTRLANARLITTEQEYAEVAHEALIREWPALRTWLDEDREGLRLHRQLTEDAQEWARLNRDDGILYRGARLAQAIGTFGVPETPKVYGALNALEREFLEASQTLAQREAAEREAARQRELDAARKLAETEKQAAARLRMRNRIITAVGALALVLAVTAVVFGLASRQNASRAENNAAEARALALAANAQKALSNDDTDLALALALEAARISVPLPARVQSTLVEVAYAPGTRRRFVGHASWVWGVAFSPDGVKALSGSADNTLILWDLESGTEIRRFTGHTGSVLSVAFSPDGRTALSGSSDRTIRLWDIEKGTEIRQFVGHSDEVTSVAFSPDGRLALSGSGDGSLRLWDANTGGEIRRFTGHTKWVWSVAFSPDGHTAVSGSDDCTARLWNMENGLEIREFRYTDALKSVAFSPDGRTILTSSADGHVILWDSETGKEIRRFIGHTSWVYGVAFSPDGQTVISGSADHSLILWNVRSGQAIRRFIGHADEVHRVAFSPDGHTVLSSSRDNTVRLWSVISGEEIRSFLHTDSVTRVAFSPDGSKALSGSADNSVTLWNVENGQVIQRFTGHTSWVTGVAFSPDGHTILSGSADKSLRLWDVLSGMEVRRFNGHDDEVTYIALSPDGLRALSASRDRSLILWDIGSGNPIRRLTGHEDWVWSVAFSPDGRTALSGSFDRTLRLWDLETGREIRRFVGHTNGIFSVAFSKDGRTGVSGSADGTVRLWDIETGKEIRRFVGFSGTVMSVAFGPDGRTVLSGLADGKLIWWDVTSGEEIRRLIGHTDAVWDLTFSADGLTALSASPDHTMRLWRMSHSLEEVMQWTRTNRYVRDLTCDERELYRVEPFCDKSNLPSTRTP